MGIEEFKIIFDRHDRTYFAGEVLKGQISIRLNSDERFDNIKVELDGGAFVSWKEFADINIKEKKGKGKKHEVEAIDQEYTNQENYILSQQMVKNGPSLKAGSHMLPFHFILSNNLPSSFDSEAGQVRYFVKAHMEKGSGQSENPTTLEQVMILGALDLNGRQEALNKAHAEDNKMLGCLCMATGPINAQLSLGRTGYVPGEKIDFSAEVENLSDKRMESSSLELVQIVTYKGKPVTDPEKVLRNTHSNYVETKTKTVTKVMQEVKRGPIEIRGTDNWEGSVIEVPALPPTDLGGISGIIDVDYKLRLRVDPPGYHWDLVVMVPIIIGTIPIQQFMGNFVNEGPVPPIEHFQKYPNIPAPRFSMMLGVKENDNGDFVHRYAIYNANTDGNNTKTDANDTKTDANDTKTDANNTKTDANNTKTDANNTDTDAKTINSEANKSNTDAKNTKTDALQTLADTIDNKSGDVSQVKTVAK